VELEDPWQAHQRSRVVREAVRLPHELVDFGVRGQPGGDNRLACFFQISTIFRGFRLL
jgi:hypothetical protein